MKVSDIQTLSMNPFWLSNVLAHFVSGHSNRAPIELAYLVMPLVLREKQRKVLSSLNAKSTIHSAFLDKKEKRVSLAALQHYVQVYKADVNKAIIVYGNRQTIEDKILSNTENHNYTSETDKKLREYYKASFNLGRIFAKEELNSCFYQLGVFFNE